MKSGRTREHNRNTVNGIASGPVPRRNDNNTRRQGEAVGLKPSEAWADPERVAQLPPQTLRRLVMLHPEQIASGALAPAARYAERHGTRHTDTKAVLADPFGSLDDGQRDALAAACERDMRLGRARGFIVAAHAPAIGRRIPDNAVADAVRRAAQRPDRIIEAMLRPGPVADRVPGDALDTLAAARPRAVARALERNPALALRVQPTVLVRLAHEAPAELRRAARTDPGSGAACGRHSGTDQRGDRARTLLARSALADAVTGRLEAVAAERARIRAREARRQG